MLFHADRNIKENLFQMYKKEAQEQHQKKNDLRLRKLNEEKEMIDNLNKREQQEDDRKKFEKYKRVTDSMNEYREFWNNKEQNKVKGRKGEVNFNTYGVSLRGGQHEMQNSKNNYKITNSFDQTDQQNFQNQNQIYSQNNFTNNYQLSTNPHELDNSSNFIRSNGLTRLQRQEQQKSYKDFLDSQVILYDLGLTKT